MKSQHQLSNGQEIDYFHLPSPVPDRKNSDSNALTMLRRSQNQARQVAVTSVVCSIARVALAVAFLSPLFTTGLSQAAGIKQTTVRARVNLPIPTQQTTSRNQQVSTSVGGKSTSGPTTTTTPVGGSRSTTRIAPRGRVSTPSITPSIFSRPNRLPNGFQTPALSGKGSARIDGYINANEWGQAARANFTIDLPGVGSTPATFYVMNDVSNLYLALEFSFDGDINGDRVKDLKDRSLEFPFQVQVSLDKNRNGIQDEDDDVILFTEQPHGGFHDAILKNCQPGPCKVVLDDEYTLGTKDGDGVLRFADLGDYEFYRLELYHPLNSADNEHDVSLADGRIVGLNLKVRMADRTISANEKEVVSFYPSQNSFQNIQIGPRVGSAPTVSAGPDQTIYYDYSQVHLMGSAEDPEDGSNLSVWWDVIGAEDLEDGSNQPVGWPVFGEIPSLQEFPLTERQKTEPRDFFLTNEDQHEARTVTFRLTATDSDGNTASDEMTVTLLKGENEGIFVSSLFGNDANSGDANNPVQTLERAFALASTPFLVERNIEPDIYVQAGDYRPANVLALNFGGRMSGTSLYGGFHVEQTTNGNHWTRTAQRPTQINGSNYILYVSDITEKTIIDGLTLVAANGSYMGDWTKVHSIPLIVSHATDQLRVSNNYLIAGAGGRGQDGVSAVGQAPSGEDGGNGGSLNFLGQGENSPFSPARGGDGCETGNPGGQGGYWLANNHAQSGENGSEGLGGSGGEAISYNSNDFSGRPGGAGETGNIGISGQGGTYDEIEGLWTFGNGENGIPGENGKGGGGGGPGGRRFPPSLFSGGGGGGGGCGGAGGQGGQSGGSSAGLFLDQATPGIANNRIKAANAGAGGNGATGQCGGRGGNGGSVVNSIAGQGGRGGSGGAGGSGGGGGGGYSADWLPDQADTDHAGNVVEVGSPGQEGEGGDLVYCGSPSNSVLQGGDGEPGTSTIHPEETSSTEGSGLVTPPECLSTGITGGTTPGDVNGTSHQGSCYLQP